MIGKIVSFEDSLVVQPMPDLLIWVTRRQATHRLSQLLVRCQPEKESEPSRQPWGTTERASQQASRPSTCDDASLAKKQEVVILWLHLIFYPCPGLYDNRWLGRWLVERRTFQIQGDPLSLLHQGLLKRKCKLTPHKKTEIPTRINNNDIIKLHKMISFKFTGTQHRNVPK